MSKDTGRDRKRKESEVKGQGKEGAVMFFRHLKGAT